MNPSATRRAPSAIDIARVGAVLSRGREYLGCEVTVLVTSQLQRAGSADVADAHRAVGGSRSR